MVGWSNAASRTCRIATVTPFFLVIGFGYAALFALIWMVPWGRGGPGPGAPGGYPHGGIVGRDGAPAGTGEREPAAAAV